MIRKPAIWVMLTVCIVVMGCSAIQEMMEDAKKAKAAIESELGGEVDVGTESIDGKITLVTVHFLKPPGVEMNLAQLKQRVTEIVEKNFRSNVQKVAISM